MAINVDTVYKTVLLILNQQQRGYMTPDEFNKVGSQVQLSIFENYSNDLNQQYRTPQNDTEYANRIKNIQEDLQFFQRTGTVTGTNPFVLVPGSTTYFPNDTVIPDVISRLGTTYLDSIELTQYAQRNEITQLLLSPLTQPTNSFPIHLYENNLLYIYPTTIVDKASITFSYLKKPQDILWGSTTGNLGELLFAVDQSRNFELNVTEQANVITRVLAYAGIIINDPTIIQVAAQQVQQDEQNSKS